MEPIETQKANQACDLLAELDLDCWLIWVRETDQIADPAMRLVLDGDLVGRSALLFTREGERIAIVANYDGDGLPEGLFDRVVSYEEGITSHLRDELGRLDPRTIAIDVSRSDVGADGMTAGMREALDVCLTETPYCERLVSAEGLIQRLRGRKLPDEVERIRRAITTTERIFDEAYERLSDGQTEREIHALFHERVRAHDVGFAWSPGQNPAVDAGPDKPFGHVGPTENRTKRGQLLHFDFGVRVDGYCSDLQRMVFFGASSEVPGEVAHAFDTLLRAIDAAAAELKPGAVGFEIDGIARKCLAERGYPEYKHGLGHQIGRNAHDGGVLLGPRWERYGASVEGCVEAGNVFTIEPNIPTQSFGRVSLEEDVLVTEDGCEFLSTPQRELICIR
jgi:Xaa-Pro aminopeptidase